MTTKQAMNTPGQHQSSITIRKMLENGKEITNLWTNGESGDWGLSVVEIDNHAAYLVDNGSAIRHPTGFVAAVAEHLLND